MHTRAQVTNPFNGDLVAEVADCGPAEAGEAVRCAKAAFETWGRLQAKERSDYVRRIGDIIARDKEELARGGGF